MKYRTYKNMERATQMIFDKGYTWEEANKMAINIFDSYDPKGLSIEGHISKILSKEAWIKETKEGLWT